MPDPNTDSPAKDKKTAPTTDSLSEASIIMGGYYPLVPGTSQYNQYYISRPLVKDSLMREAQRANRSGRSFNWFFTGHTGSGKSTELNRIIADEKLLENYIPIYIDLESDFDVYNIEYTDMILAMAKGCMEKADELKCRISPVLKDEIENWGAKFLTEKEIKTRTEGKAGLSFSLPFLALGEEVHSGGGQRDAIRKEISTKIPEFIKLIDELSATIFYKVNGHVLCVLDGLDHADVKKCLDIMHYHYETIVQPAISKIIVIPLSLLNEEVFVPRIQGCFSTVPNIKVFKEQGSDEIDRDGFKFYRDLVSRYIYLDKFTEEALASLFRLSAGILRDMIRNTGDACAYTMEDNSKIVDVKHTRRVWNEMKRFYRMQLKRADYEVLRYVAQNPSIEGKDGIPPLLHSKAVVFYPNGEGWYGVHPAVSEIINQVN